MIDVLKRIALGLLVALAFFVLVEGVLWAAGVDPLHENEDPLVGFAGYSPLFVPQTAGSGESVFATARNKLPWFNQQQFAARKAPGVTRVFCLGGSTTFGRPYDDRTSFCGWLRAYLPTVDPDRRWEVINAGGVSYASYRVTRLMKALSDHDPDLFVVYTGHNEFLESRTYDQLIHTPAIVRDVASLASRLRLYSVLDGVINRQVDVLATEVDAVLDRSVGPVDYHRDDAMRDAILGHFRESLGRMVNYASDAGSRVIFVTPASNIGDFSPFKAEPSPGLSEAQVGNIAEQFQLIQRALDEGNPELAAFISEQALNTDSRNAELQFLHGQALRELGSIDAARRAFIMARDEDIAPLRALTAVSEVVSDVAIKRGTGFVDFADMVRELSPDRIPGNELFLDHVHPTIDANRMLARAILDEMIRLGLVEPAATWTAAAIAEVTERVESGVDEEANAMALKNLSKVLQWAGKHEEAAPLINQSLELESNDAEAYFQKARLLWIEGRPEEALPYTEDAVRLVPTSPMFRMGHGVVLSKLGRKDEARSELEYAAAADPNLPGVHHELGIVLGGLGEDALAEAQYRIALESEPDNADTCNNLGVLLAKSGDLRGAAELFQRAVLADPGHENAADNLEQAKALLAR